MSIKFIFINFKNFNIFWKKMIKTFEKNWNKIII